jgi:hypothetical protein
VIYDGGSNLGLSIRLANVRHDHTPRIYDHAVPVTDPLFVMSSNLHVW